MEPRYDTTLMLRDLCHGDQAAAERLLPLIYAELRALAGAHFKAQPADHTLQATALVHEAYLRLINHQDAGWNGKAHFFAVAAAAMRQILCDHARRRHALKRGGDGKKVMLDAAAHEMRHGDEPERGGIDVVALEELLRRLETLDERKHRVVELRFFGGMSVEEVAEAMGISRSTVEADWRAARAWLRVELSK
jgi:RNA polymerase sigma factor (TIGR02999 family)